MAGDEGDVGLGVVFVGLQFAHALVVAVEGAVVGGEDDQGVLPQIELIELVKDAAELVVEESHFSGVAGAQVAELSVADGVAPGGVGTVGCPALNVVAIGIKLFE